MITDSRFILDIVLFVAVADHGSFTQAAEELGISKSVVSKRITRLEQNLKAQLFHRTTRKISLTEVGEVFHLQCSAIKEDIETAVDVVTNHYQKPHGLLRISSPQSFVRYELAPLVSEFMHQYPDIKVELYPGNYYENIFENSIDVAIRLGDLADSSLHARKIMSSRMGVCASPAYLKRNGIPEHPEDLLKHNCLRYTNSPMGNSWEFMIDNENTALEVDGSFSATSSASVREAAISDLGVAMLPGYMFRNAVNKGMLVDLLKDYCVGDMNVYAVYPPTRFVSPKVRLFIDFLAQSY